MGPCQHKLFAPFGVGVLYAKELIRQWSFAVDNTESDVDRAVSAVHDAVRGRVSIGT